VLPNLLSWPGPAVVLDVKGEIYAGTSKWRSKNVGPVFRFSPLDPANSHSYNPLVFIRDDADYLWEDSRFLADMLIVPSGATDPFWENSARDVITAAIAYLCQRFPPDQRPMSKLMDLIYGIGWDEMVNALRTNLLVGAMRQTGQALADMERKQRDSVLKTAQSSLSAWQGERLARVTRKSDWNPADLRLNNATIYICINPNEIDSYLSVLRVFIAQHIRALTSSLPPRDSAPVLFVLDELPRLRKMPPVDEALSIGRQYGIRLWMFAQSYGQLKESYPNAEGMLGSCSVRTFMNVPLNDELAQKLSDQLGYRDGPLDNTRIKVVEPIELAGPGYRDYTIVVATNTKPARARKAFAYRDPELTARMGSVS
jgi:type IV secretion system protein VirD4